MGTQGEGDVAKIGEKALNDRPLPLRIVYNTLFHAKFNKNIIESSEYFVADFSFNLLEHKEVLHLDTEGVTTMTAHPGHPLLFVGTKQGDVLVLWPQTMKVIQILEGAKQAIQALVLSNTGDRIAAIDASANVLVWRFNLLAKRIKHTTYFKNANAQDFLYLNDSSALAVLTKDTLMIKDLLLGSSTTVSVASDFGGTNVVYSAAYQRILVLNLKKKKVLTIPVNSLQTSDEATIEYGGELTAHVSNKEGTVICYGTQEGEVLIYKTKTMEQISVCKPFEKEAGRLFGDSDKKLKAVAGLTLIEGWVVAFSFGGTVSLVTKI